MPRRYESGAPPMAFLNVKLIHSLCSLWPPKEDEYIAEMIRPLALATRPRVSDAARSALTCSEITPLYTCDALESTMSNG